METAQLTPEIGESQASPAQVLWPRLTAIGALIVAVIATGWVMSLRDSTVAQTFVVIFVSIVIQALPFLLLGIILATLVQRFMNESTIARVARLRAPGRYAIAAVAGVGVPACECGSVPIARSLADKGLQPGVAVTHMLAAPIINPLVLASTYIAFKGTGMGWQMTLARSGFGVAIAIVAGVLVEKFAPESLRPQDCDSHEEHLHGARSMLSAIGTDLISLGKFLVIGAAAAALIQTLLPRGFLLTIGSNFVIATATMMLLAVILSLCSSSDAFVAASLRQFTPASQLSFMLLGPMVDLKLVPLYSGVFSRRVVAIIVGTAVGGTILSAIAMAAVTG